MKFYFPLTFDHCIFDGFEIKPDFDPMIGKLIVRAHSRAVALRKMDMALKNLHLDGVKTNIPLHEIIIKEPQFVAGTYTTNYITEVKPQEKVLDLISEEAYYKKAIENGMNGMSSKPIE